MRDLRRVYRKKEFAARGKEFNKKYELERTDEKAYKELKKKKNANKWTESKYGFKDKLNKYTQGCCPICEREIDQHADIEHYRPKDHYWWLAYDFYNYYNCCKLCNITYKKNLFPLLNGETDRVDFSTRHQIEQEQPLLYNPLKDNPFELFELEFDFVSAKGPRSPILKIRPNEKILNTQYKLAKAQTTIAVFNLNHEKPERARLTAMRKAGVDLWQLVAYMKERNEGHISQEKFRYIKNDYVSEKGLFLSLFVLKGQFKVVE